MVRATHRLSLAPAAASAALRRGALASQFFRPVASYTALPPGVTPAQWAASHRAAYSALTAPLPPQVSAARPSLPPPSSNVCALPPPLHLLTAHAQSPTSVLLRLSHSCVVPGAGTAGGCGHPRSPPPPCCSYEAGEDAQLSQPASASLATLFAAFPIANCTETTATANQPLSAAPQVTYRLDNGTAVTLPVVPPPPAGPGLRITLGPMEIRTFLCAAGEPVE